MRGTTKQVKKAQWIEDELLTADDFAWAFLRRNPDYRCEAEKYGDDNRSNQSGIAIYSSGEDDEKAQKWGLEFFRQSR